MKTWGDLRIADAHVHFFSAGFFQSLAPAPVDSLGWELPPAEPARLAERWVNELDRHGVARAALIASAPGDEASVAAAVAHAPDRFFGYFMLNPTAADARDRVERAFTTARLQGICLFPAMHRYSVQDERVQPIFDLAAAYAGSIVFVHCGVLTVGIRKKLGLPSPFDMRYSNAIDLHAVALRNPRVNFVVPHFGAGYLREALMLCDLCPNVYLDTSSSNSWMRYENLTLAEVYRRALEVAGPRRLLFGSDSSFFPRGWNAHIFQQQTQVLSDLAVSAEDAKAIFGGNLEALLAR